jgi:hypothetical protein
VTGGAGPERDLLDELPGRAERIPALHPRHDGLDRGQHGFELRPDLRIAGRHRGQRRLVRDHAANQVRSPRGEADGDGGPEGGARHVRRLTAEALDQRGEIVLLVPSRSLDIALAAAVTAAVVGHDPEGRGQLGRDGLPVVAVRPATVDQH